MYFAGKTPEKSNARKLMKQYEIDRYNPDLNVTEH